MKKQSFNNDWTYYKEGTEQKIKIQLPHDAMIHEKRDSKSPSGGAGAYFPGGVYVYEKTFSAPLEWENQSVIFEFEGIYRNSKVFINDREVGGRPYGYSNFFVEANEDIQYGKENILRVVADNSQMPNSRWYSGSGMYRPVYLYLGGKQHIQPEGVKISTLSHAPAKILVETSCSQGEVEIEIFYGNTVVAVGEGTRAEIDIPNAKLWSEETPNLYTCKVTLSDKEQIVDETTETFGIRKIEWSNQGFFVNGQNTLLRGGCIHHDNGILGASTEDQSEARRIRILKEAGFNAVRISHNPCSKAMLQACDEQGMYVIDESFDMWYSHKNKYDYASDFEKWHLIDTKSMVDKDFNHPSVIMYSIGNEVSEPYQEKGVETTKRMVAYIHTLDQTRPVSGGINLMIISLASKGKGIYKEGGGRDEKNDQKATGSLFFNMLTSMIGTGMNKMANSKAADRVTSPCLDALDICGYNYASGRYKMEGKKHPDRILVGSETFPQDIAKNWAMVQKYPYLIGDFMWAGWDYLGEAGIGGWSYTGGGMTKPYPWLIADTGAIDIIGTIGAQAKYASTVWGLEKKPAIFVKPVNHPGERVMKAVWRGTNAIESWSWKNCEGNKAEVEVYAQADQVELLLNGKVIGKKTIKNCKAIFKTTYKSGKLEAVSYDANKKEIGRHQLTSATGTTQIRLAPEESHIKAGDLLHVNIQLVGANGSIESNDDQRLHVEVEGGVLLGFGSAIQATEEGYDTGYFPTYYGRSLAVIRVGTGKDLRIKTSAQNLTTVSDKAPVQTPSPASLIMTIRP